MELNISIIALLASFLSLGWQTFTWKKQYEQSRLNENLTLLAEIKMQLAQKPEVYRFHGITKEMMRDCDIDEKELAYVVTNFISGQIYYEAIEKDSKTPFPDDDYRAIMCKTEAIKKAWPIVKILLDKTSYRDKVEKTIEKYHN